MARRKAILERVSSSSALHNVESVKGKHDMKIILSILTLLVFALPIQAAGLGNPETIALTSTNSVAATSTNSSASILISTANAKDLALQLRFKGTGADTGNLVIKLSKGVNGYAEDGAFFSWTVAANGTNYVS